MAIQDGKVYIVTSEGFTYAGQISGAFDGSANMIDVTTKDSSGWSEFIPGLKGGTLSVEGLNDWADSDGFSRPLGQWINGTQCTWTFGYTSSGNQIGGEAYIEGISLNGNNDEAAGYSCTLRVTGAVAEAAV